MPLKTRTSGNSEASERVFYGANILSKKKNGSYLSDFIRFPFGLSLAYLSHEEVMKTSFNGLRSIEKFIQKE
jgi:hypothetical protein